MKNYSRDVVIGKLARHGITVGQGEIVIKKELSVGIKLWGMIDFIGFPYRRGSK